MHSLILCIFQTPVKVYHYQIPEIFVPELRTESSIGQKFILNVGARNMMEMKTLEGMSGPRDSLCGAFQMEVSTLVLPGEGNHGPTRLP